MMSPRRKRHNEQWSEAWTLFERDGPAIGRREEEKTKEKKTIMRVITKGRMKGV